MIDDVIGIGDLPQGLAFVTLPERVNDFETAQCLI